MSTEDIGANGIGVPGDGAALAKEPSTPKPDEPKAETPEPKEANGSEVPAGGDAQKGTSKGVPRPK